MRIEREAPSMKRLFRARLSKMTLLAFATSLLIVPAASAFPVDPGEPGPPTHQTIIVPAKTKAPTKKQVVKWYRSSAPVSGHGPVLP
jgi:hypothetical protein